MIVLVLGVCCIVLPINAHRGQKLPDDFDEILQAKANLGIYLKEKCYSEHYKRLSLIYFKKSVSIPKLLSKVSKIQTTLSRRNL